MIIYNGITNCGVRSTPAWIWSLHFLMAQGPITEVSLVFYRAGPKISGSGDDHRVYINDMRRLHKASDNALEIKQSITHSVVMGDPSITAWHSVMQTQVVPYTNINSPRHTRYMKGRIMEIILQK